MDGMTPSEQHVAEWRYRYSERLGIMLDSGVQPTREQVDVAAKWVDENTPNTEFFSAAARQGEAA